ncbi:chromate efflux transporter [Photobacterium leiognathi]|uniref:chromate efflux transporter n=1 Tax=Photobacterium leiognathi TaxID=553611 RepID=UPI0029822EC4|nr:chromate efflux transporter [Photobacterium leiognathi]
MFTVFSTFLLLGLYSFGGPAAHIGFFQRAFVQEKKWISDDDFNHAVALCQFLPGPASSQLGMYIGYKKAGYLGAVAAFIGFTLPSFALLTAVAMASSSVTQNSVVDSLILAAKLLAVIVVADALWGMAKKNLTSAMTIMIAVITAIWVYFSTGLLGQILPICIAAAIGYGLSYKNAEPAKTQQTISIKPHMGILSTFIILLVVLPLMASYSQGLNLFNIFYQAGSFVFGGGHVVLPLLQPMMEGLVSESTFINAYASAQLVPGPMFTMASYLGASIDSLHPILGSLIATIAVFLPGALLLFAFVPAWKALFAHQRLKHSITLVNASVVGLLASAFVTPIMTSGIKSWFDIVLVVVGFIAFKQFKCPVWLLAALLFVANYFIVI